MKRVLLIGGVVAVLSAVGLGLALGWLLMTESGLRWAVAQAQRGLPGELTVQRLEGRLTGPLVVGGVRYRLNETVVEVDGAALDWRASSLWAAMIHVDYLHVDGVRVALPSPQEQASEPLVLPDVRLPWRTVVDDLQVNDLSIKSADGQPIEVANIALQASALFNRIDIRALSVSADAFEVELAGVLHPVGRYRHDVRVGWQVSPPGYPRLTGQGRLQGDTRNTRLSQVVTGPFSMNLDLQLHDFLMALRWEAEIEMSDVDTTRLNPQWPKVQGRLTLRGEGDLEVAAVAGEVAGRHGEFGPFDGRFRLQRQADNLIVVEHLMAHSAVSDTRLEARGVWRPGADGGRAELALHWRKLRWPLEGVAWFDSAVGSGWFSGGAADYRVGLATAEPWPQAPESTWFTTARGDMAGLEGVRLRIEGLDGEVAVDGQVTWLPQLRWRAQVTGVALDPSVEWVEWPGRLNVGLTGEGGLEGEAMVAEIDLHRLDGQLRDYPVESSGRFRWDGRGLDVAALALRSGDSRVTASGRLAEEVDLQWRVEAENLAALHPDAQGRLHAQGDLSGPLIAPHLVMTFDGADVAFQAFRAEALTGALEAELFRWRQLAVDVEARRGSVHGYSVARLDIEGVGADGRHELALRAASSDGEVALRVAGALAGTQWQGRLEQADVVTQAFGQWQLQGENAIRIAPQATAIGPLCWGQADAEMCLEAEGGDDGWHGRLQADEFALETLAPLLPEGLGLEGTLGLQARVSAPPRQPMTGRAVLSLSPGVVAYPLLEGDRDRWPYAGGELAAELTAEGVSGRMALALTNGDRLAGTLLLPGLDVATLDVATQPMTGQATLIIEDLGLIEALVPEVQNLRGEASVALSAGGTLGRPRLSSIAELTQGTLRIPRLGLKIDQLAFNAQSEGMDTLAFSLRGRSGGGTLAVEGRSRLDPAQGWPTEVTVKGKDVEVSRIPEARVDVSPELSIALQGRSIRVEGEVHIPYAKLQPKDVTMAVTASDDVVIVGGPESAVEKWQIHTRVRITLGERVTLFGFGFEGAFGGTLVVEDEPGQLTRASGEVVIPQGRYRAYGQRLEVESGRVLYTGGPLTNPGLDIRAVRRVGEVTAGLKLGGTLRDPTAELFSIPAMGQTDALAYLVLGRPLEQTSSGEEGQLMARAALALGLAGGDRLARSLADRFGLDEMRIETAEGGDQASLMMGRYLSPRLYVGYGIGLLENTNLFKLRYRLSNQWQLESESGEHHGADLIYSIETGRP